jgi:heat-inducible transcriptional repressor
MMTMDERKKRILQAIVNSYIDSAEPVGSRFIARRYDLGVSPATIRNEMSDLEELGYLEQPHTSAGRIPSDKGYRFYVDFLLGIHQLASREISCIDEWYQNRAREIDLQIQRTVKILSQMTNYTSLIIGPSLSAKALRYLQILPITEGSAVIVLVNDAGIVEHRHVDIPVGISDAEMEEIARIMNDRLRGRSLDDVKQALFQELHTQLAHQMTGYQLVQDTLAKVIGAMDDTQSTEERIYLGGTTNILNQPEFKDVEKARTILTLLEEESVLRHVLAGIAPSGISIHIGQENPVEEMKHCSMVTARYAIGGKTLGTIGVIGPTRMDYGRVITILELITRNLSDSLDNKKTRN